MSLKKEVRAERGGRYDEHDPLGTCAKEGRPGADQIFIGMGTLQYCDGTRGILFSWEANDEKAEKVVLHVPSKKGWTKRCPFWSHGRRDEILSTVKRLSLARGWDFVFIEFD